MNAVSPEEAYSAHVDAWQAHGRLFAALGGGAADLPGWRLMASGLPYPYLNSACVTEAAVADIEVARAWYLSRKLTWGVILRAGTRWPHGRHLLTQQLMASGPSSFSGAPAPDGLVLRRAAKDDVDEIVAIDNGAFGSNPEAARAWLGPLCSFSEVRVAIGELDGRPVAAGYGTTVSGRAGQSLYVGGLGVLPEARRRGIAAALLTWLLKDGFEAGASLVHLQTDSRDAARLYSKLGFAQCGSIDIYSVD